MSQPFIGEIRCFGFSFAPYQWALCNGQSMSIANFQALFAVIGTIYGGDGQTTFNLPNLQGYAPMHWGTGGGPATGLNTTIGQVQGTPTVTLTTPQTPSHTHTITAMDVASGGEPEKTPNPGTTTWLGPANPDFLYFAANPTINAPFAGNAITQVGASQPHENMQPYLALNFCISLYGVYPSIN
jgi:microcystin-dependent protein